MFTPHCAAVHPLRLARARSPPRRPGRGPHRRRRRRRRRRDRAGVTTTAGTIRADVVVLATEAYTSQLPGRRRDLLPIYSMMIGSEPLSDEQWDDIGLADRQTFTVASHVVIYGQRTADGRMAFGGRGAPYHFGSRVDDRFDTDDASAAPAGDTVDVDCSRCSATSSSRTTGADRWPRRATGTPTSPTTAAPGIASAGGYVGDGVADGEPRRAHAGRPDPRSRHRSHPAAVGRAPVAAMGAGAAALAGCPPRRQRRPRRPGRASPASRRPSGRLVQARRPAHRSLKPIVRRRNR